MSSIQRCIHASLILACLLCCTPSIVVSANLEGTSPEQLITHVRAQHFPKYPGNEGFPTIGESLEKFFSNGAWKYEMRNYPGEVVSFSGIAKCNGKNVRVKWIFSILTAKDLPLFPYGTVIHESILVNDTRISDKELGDILATVMLN